MKQIMFVAGEASGDNHGADVIKHLMQQGDVQCFGIGGDKMRAAGMEALFDINDIAVVGFIEVIKHIKPIRAAWHVAVQALEKRQPDVLVLIDYPGFNLRLAKKAKALGITVLYYISPQIWAWHQSRVYKIKQCVDHMAVVFPFEVPFYEKAGVPVTYVGSPLTEQVHPIAQEAARIALSLNAQTQYIGLAPGSRMSELTRLLPAMLDAADLLFKEDPTRQFLLPIASTLKPSDFSPYLAQHPHLPIQLIEHNTHNILAACDAVMCTSGTATLETAILGVPMVILYKTTPLTYQLAKRLVKVDHIGLCNIVAGKRAVPELIQHEATAENIKHALLPLLTDPQRQQAIKTDLAIVREKLGQPGAAKQVVMLIQKLCA